MNTSTALIAALGVRVVVASAVFFVFGRRSGAVIGRTEELTKQQAAKASAEELRKRIVADAEREADTMRKSAIVAGKEELIKLREAWETEARRRREEVEREERKVQERDSQIERKVDILEQRERE